MSTELEYLGDSEQYESTAILTDITLGDDNSATLILSRTIFYPQGGGQPTDKGEITGDSGKMNVERVYFREGIVFHEGSTMGSFLVGERLRLRVDVDLRLQHARLHTGGHLVMTAIDRLFGLPSVKGYHFPNGPYVEFEGSVDLSNKDDVLSKIQGELDKIVMEESPVVARFESIESLLKQGVHMPAEIPAGKPARIVITAGYKSPCGGTHVKTTGQLQGLRVRGVKARSGNLRVSYDLT